MQKEFYLSLLFCCYFMKAACLKCEYSEEKNKRKKMSRIIECMKDFVQEAILKLKIETLSKNHEKLPKRRNPKTKILKTFEMDALPRRPLTGSALYLIINRLKRHLAAIF